MSRLCSCRFCVGILLPVLLAILAANLPAQQSELTDAAKTGKPLLAAILPAQAVEQHAPYWSSEPGWDTELQLKNNLAAASLTVTPVLRLASGQEIALDH